MMIRNFRDEIVFVRWFNLYNIVQPFSYFEINFGLWRASRDRFCHAPRIEKISAGELLFTLHLATIVVRRKSCSLKKTHATGAVQIKIRCYVPRSLEPYFRKKRGLKCFVLSSSFQEHFGAWLEGALIRFREFRISASSVVSCYKIELLLASA